MAEPCNVAFGRYLKMLRERRGLSLDNVDSLSRTFPEPIGKTYLSRCENGKQKLAFPKMIPLSRIYEVPAEVLCERMELDLELDRVGGPDTEGLSYRELNRKGKAASARGSFWNAYAFLREATKEARGAELLDGMANSDEQFMCSIMSFTIVASRLGAQRLSLYELDFVRECDDLSAGHLVSLFILLSQRYADRGEITKAHQLATDAIDTAKEANSDVPLAHSYGHLAHLMYGGGKLEEATELYMTAFSLFKRASTHGESARILLNLAQLYFDARRFAAAKRALTAAERIAVRHDLDRSRALVRVLRGEIAAREGQGAIAVRHWREAISMSKRLKDRVTRFKAEFQLYKYSVSAGDTATAQALERLMRKRALLIPGDVFELGEFKKMSTGRERA